jgi:LPXTG-motif cell wall-anchored protein
MLKKVSAALILLATIVLFGGVPASADDSGYQLPAGGGSLPSTGASTELMITVAALTVAIGVLLFEVARRRTAHTS